MNVLENIPRTFFVRNSESERNFRVLSFEMDSRILVETLDHLNNKIAKVIATENCSKFIPDSKTPAHLKQQCDFSDTFFLLEQHVECLQLDEVCWLFDYVCDSVQFSDSKIPGIPIVDESYGANTFTFTHANPPESEGQTLHQISMPFSNEIGIENVEKSSEPAQVISAKVSKHSDVKLSEKNTSKGFSIFTEVLPNEIEKTKSEKSFSTPTFEWIEYAKLNKRYLREYEWRFQTFNRKYYTFLAYFKKIKSSEIYQSMLKSGFDALCKKDEAFSDNNEVDFCFTFFNKSNLNRGYCAKDSIHEDLLEKINERIAAEDETYERKFENDIVQLNTVGDNYLLGLEN